MRLDINETNKTIIIYRIINSKLKWVTISYENIEIDRLITRLKNAYKLSNEDFIRLINLS